VGVSIASERCGDDTYRGYTFIPTGMVMSVTPMKRKRATRIKPLKVKEETL